MALALGGANEGVASVELWRSGDDAFDAGQDSLLASADTLDPATSTPDSLTVGSVDWMAPTSQTFVFVVVDLTASASGDVRASVQDSSDVTTAGGTLANAGADFPLALSGDATPLPVELAAFDARVEDAAVRLAWHTASETNNAGFRVERKRAGTRESPSGWTTVGSVEGRGTTSQPQSYRFVDEDLPFDAEALTYRLVQVDVDGTTHTSDPVTVERGVDRVQLLGTAPNPARTQATLRYALPEKQPTTIRLYDVLGRQVKTLVRAPQSGRHERAVDLSGLSSGVYFLRLTAGGHTRTQKLTVVR
jgi:hypothetical protein